MTLNLENMQPKMSSSEEMFQMYSLRSKESKSEKIGIEPGTSYEVFRNSNTAVEVIVKEVPLRYRKLTQHNQDVTGKDNQREVEYLKTELNQANINLISTRNGFKSLVFELKKQLEAANHREIDRQARNIALELENEKLRTLLESKSKLAAKMKKELINIRRVLKFIIKTIYNGPQMPQYYNFSLDPEYDNFEKELRKEYHVKFAPNMLADSEVLTFESTLSKNQNSFEK